MAWSSSPAPICTSTTRVSTMSAASISDWPTPTVSTSTTSKPAASHSRRLARVRAATPPSTPDAGDGRMNARGSRDSRVRSSARRTAAGSRGCEAAGFDVVLVETVGVGQSEIDAAD
ncbi:MAG: hypothetical protein IAG13_29150, partial [Deltaproteobacteria bacterium]|nr:hypothetical protein [Nannocystaceae bacterium]